MNSVDPLSTIHDPRSARVRREAGGGRRKENSSFPRRREPRRNGDWIPAYAGMTAKGAGMTSPQHSALSTQHSAHREARRRVFAFPILSGQAVRRCFPPTLTLPPKVVGRGVMQRRKEQSSFPRRREPRRKGDWIPASAGMTEKGAGMTEKGAGMTEKGAGMTAAQHSALSTQHSALSPQHSVLSTQSSALQRSGRGVWS